MMRMEKMMKKKLYPNAAKYRRRRSVRRRKERDVRARCVSWVLRGGGDRGGGEIERNEQKQQPNASMAWTNKMW